MQVGDFGLSRLATATRRNEDAGAAAAAAAGGYLCPHAVAATPSPIRTRAVGTLHWMPPEVMRGLPQGPPVDVFAYGIVLYELAAEALPYLRLADPQEETTHRQQQQQQQRIDRKNAWLPSPAEICAAVLRGERPDERFVLPECPAILR